MYLKEIGVNARTWVDSVENRGYWKALMNGALLTLVNSANKIFIR